MTSVTSVTSVTSAVTLPSAADGSVPGYNAGGEALPASGPRVLPAWWFGYYDHVLCRDRATGQWFFETLGPRRTRRPGGGASRS